MTKRNYVCLPQPNLLDFTTLKDTDDVLVIIQNTQHKFATDAQFSGTDVMKQPIFGSKVYINGKQVSKTTYGLPFMRMAQGSCPKITYYNKTKFTFNIHYHGLNTMGNIDGVSMETVFGLSTQLGPKVTFQFPEITNNQSLLFFHSHSMFVSMEYIYGGLVGLLQIVDEQTKWLTKEFEYGDNNLLLEALDMDLTNNGTQTFANLVTDENRSCFSVINGVSALNWYSSDLVPFVNPLIHKTDKNLVKIDILNASLNWRVFHIGVCDKNRKIKSFHIVQTDSGLINPKEVTMAFVPVASRLGLIIDLKDFKDEVAYIFFYNYDLTEILNTEQTFPDEPNNPTLTATIPDFTSVKNATPFPTPIPSSSEHPDDISNLNYPIVPFIHKSKEILHSGTIPVPQQSGFKIFLKIKRTGKESSESLSHVISRIRKTVFGKEHYKKYKDILKDPKFEYDLKHNYLTFLNPKYFYNLPDFKCEAPLRNIFLFSETDTNALTPNNPYGTTEYINGANRIYIDLWNSNELNLDWALSKYKENPNNYKPSVLPTSKFHIRKTNDTYSNTAMISNDTLIIQIYDNQVAYGDLSAVPLTSVKVIFPPTSGYLNIQQWIDLINETFAKTPITIGKEEPTTLDKLFECDWSFFPYALNFLYQKTAYIKSATIKTRNKSKYWIRFLARWPLLQFFGKPMTGDTLQKDVTMMTRLRSKINRNKVAHNNVQKLKPERLCTNKHQSLYVKCNEKEIYGIYDAEIQQVFPYYATSNGDEQLPIACMKRNGELIISPEETYIGLYDGYLNDNMYSFSVKLKTTETWIYTNGDTADAHSLHFHLTSAFASPQSTYNSPGLLSYKKLNNQLIYGRDIYQIGPQEQIAFTMTWPYYSSNETTTSPNLPGLGAVIHCHFLLHTDSSSMMNSYYVDP